MGTVVLYQSRPARINAANDAASICRKNSFLFSRLRHPGDQTAIARCRPGAKQVVNLSALARTMRFKRLEPDGQNEQDVLRA